jgi:hypothetical protein
VISTAAIVKGLHADYDPMSESGYMLLKRSLSMSLSYPGGLT